MDEHFRQRLADIVTQARGDMNQRDFGEKLDVSQSAVVGWEKGTSVPNLENLAKLAALRGQLPEELLAELYGRVWTSDYPLEDRIKIMTSKQLVDLLSLLSVQLRQMDL